MRLFLLTFLTVVLAVAPVAADQTDPRLDTLFEELRTGDGLDADITVDRIEAIWSDSQSDTVDVLYSRAVSSVEGNSLDVASALLDHAVGLSPNFAQAYALRGVVRMRQLNQRGAIEDFSKVLELEPRQFDIRVQLAEILLANGAKRDAYDMLQKALEWNPHDEYARRKARSLRQEIDGQEI